MQAKLFNLIKKNMELSNLKFFMKVKQSGMFAK